MGGVAAVIIALSPYITNTVRLTFGVTQEKLNAQSVTGRAPANQDAWDRSKNIRFLSPIYKFPTLSTEV
jgi:hypothetical protein